eukprot:m.75542 g.75542  ORF g.75542 m.75542 type:complete len:630 (+) comp14485_c0_seq1:3634-5523(+)
MLPTADLTPQNVSDRPFSLPCLVVVDMHAVTPLELEATEPRVGSARNPKCNAFVTLEGVGADVVERVNAIVTAASDAVGRPVPENSRPLSPGDDGNEHCRQQQQVEAKPPAATPTHEPRSASTADSHSKSSEEQPQQDTTAVEADVFHVDAQLLLQSVTKKLEGQDDMLRTVGRHRGQVLGGQSWSRPTATPQHHRDAFGSSSDPHDVEYDYSDQGDNALEHSGVLRARLASAAAKVEMTREKRVSALMERKARDDFEHRRTQLAEAERRQKAEVIQQERLARTQRRRAPPANPLRASLAYVANSGARRATRAQLEQKQYAALLVQLGEEHGRQTRAQELCRTKEITAAQRAAQQDLLSRAAAERSAEAEAKRRQTQQRRQQAEDDAVALAATLEQARRAAVAHRQQLRQHTDSLREQRHQSTDRQLKGDVRRRMQTRKDARVLASQHAEDVLAQRKERAREDKKQIAQLRSTKARAAYNGVRAAVEAVKKERATKPQLHQKPTVGFHGLRVEPPKALEPVPIHHSLFDGPGSNVPYKPTHLPAAQFAKSQWSKLPRQVRHEGLMEELSRRWSTIGAFCHQEQCRLDPSLACDSCFSQFYDFSVDQLQRSGVEAHPATRVAPTTLPPFK